MNLSIFSLNLLIVLMMSQILAHLSKLSIF